MSNKSIKLPINAKWEMNCQGKQDYDANVLAIWSRSYPERDWSVVGGGITKPSAVAGLYLIHSEDGENDYTTILKEKFEGETEAEVQVQVEQWAQKVMDRLVEFAMSIKEIDETI